MPTTHALINTSLVTEYWVLTILEAIQGAIIFHDYTMKALPANRVLIKKTLYAHRSYVSGLKFSKKRDTKLIIVLIFTVVTEITTSSSLLH